MTQALPGQLCPATLPTSAFTIVSELYRTTQAVPAHPVLHVYIGHYSSSRSFELTVRIRCRGK